MLVKLALILLILAVVEVALGTSFHRDKTDIENQMSLEDPLTSQIAAALYSVDNFTIALGLLLILLSVQGLIAYRNIQGS